ncbi:MAG: hypothetical protein AAB433_17815 [Nitrospirota bacterium]
MPAAVHSAGTVHNPPSDHAMRREVDRVARRGEVPVDRRCAAPLDRSVQKIIMR